jgi:thermitase
LSFIPFIQSNESKPLVAIDTAGALTLYSDKKTKAFVGVVGKKNANPLFKSNNKKQVKIKEGKWSLLAANKQQGVSKIVQQNAKSMKVKVTELLKKGNAYALSPEADQFNPGSKGYQDQETFFGVNFNGEYPINYWSPNSYFKYLWGFSLAGDKGGGNAIEAFNSLKSPREDLNIDSGQNLIAVLDTGIRRTHEDIFENIWINSNESPVSNGMDNDNNGFIDDRNGISFQGNGNYVTSDQGIRDTHGHGSHVAGTIGAKANRLGVIGTNPEAKIMSISVMGSDGIGEYTDIANGIYYAAIMGSKIINMSLIGGYSLAIEQIMQKASDSTDCLFVAAAGNSNNDNDIFPDLSYPASLSLDSIISVAASSSGGRKASFSNYGKQSVDLFAPGDGIVSLNNYGNSSYNSRSGTSMAAPYVSGAISSFWSRNLELSASDVKNKLLSTVYKKPDFADSLTGGVIDMGALLKGGSGRGLIGIDELSAAELQSISLWKEKFEIDADEITGFPERRITNTVFAYLPESSLDKSSKTKLFDRINSRKGIFKNIIKVNLYESLDLGFVSFGFNQNLPIGRKEVLERFFEKGIFETIELSQTASIF